MVYVDACQTVVAATTNREDYQMIKIGQAKLSRTASGAIWMTYKNFGSDLVGERCFATLQAAVEFCRSRMITII